MNYKPQPKTGMELMGQIAKTPVPHGVLAVWFLGQESVVVKGGDTVISVDPYLSPSPHRVFAPPLTPQQLKADYVLITHEHLDHLDPATLSAMDAEHPQARYIAPAYCREMMLGAGISADRLYPASTNQWRELEGFRIMPIPAAHEELDYDPERDHRFVGYVIELNGVTLYHAGDTTIYPGLIESLRKMRIELGLLPINGRDAFRTANHIIGNMNYREAAELAVAAEFDTVIPLHYDMFAGNSEHPGYFVDYLYDRYPTQKSHVLARFERYFYISDKAFQG